MSINFNGKWVCNDNDCEIDEKEMVIRNGEVRWTNCTGDGFIKIENVQDNQFEHITNQNERIVWK